MFGRELDIIDRKKKFSPGDHTENKRVKPNTGSTT